MTPEYLSRPHKFIRNCIMKSGKTAIGLLRNFVSPSIHPSSSSLYYWMYYEKILRPSYVPSFSSESYFKTISFLFSFLFFFVTRAMRIRYRVELRIRKENIYFREVRIFAKLLENCVYSLDGIFGNSKG